MRITTIATLLVLVCGGCADRLEMESRMTMDGAMNMKMDGAMHVDGVFKVDGPLQIEMRGPSVEYTGVFISEALLDRVDVNDTREDWVLAVLGEPTERSTLRDGSEIWKWSYRPMSQTASLVSILKLDDDEPKPVHSTSFLHIRDGVVVDKWRD